MCAFLIIQYKPENSGIGRQFLDSSYDFKNSPYDITHNTHAVQIAPFFLLSNKYNSEIRE